MGSFPNSRDFGRSDSRIRPGHAAGSSSRRGLLRPDRRCNRCVDVAIGRPLLAGVQGEVIAYGLRSSGLVARFHHIPIGRICWAYRLGCHSCRHVLARRVRGPPFA